MSALEAELAVVSTPMVSSAIAVARVIAVEQRLAELELVVVGVLAVLVTSTALTHLEAL